MNQIMNQNDSSASPQSDSAKEKAIKMLGYLALSVCFFLALIMFAVFWQNNAATDTAAVIDSVTVADQTKGVAPAYWDSEAKSIREGVLEPHGYILELQVAYADDALPALSIVSASRKNGYSPDVNTLPGNLSLVLYDNKDNAIFTRQFGIPELSEAPPLAPDSAPVRPQAIDLGSASFALTVPWFSRARTAVIYDENGYEITSLGLEGVSVVNNIPHFKTLAGEKAVEMAKGKKVSQADDQKSWLRTMVSLLMPDAEANNNNNGVLDIVYVGDGYTDMAQFYVDVDRMITNMLSYEPYKSRASQIVFHTVENTKSLGCAYSGRLLTCDTYLAAQAVNNAGAPYDYIAIIVNNGNYGGAGYYGSAGVSYNGSWGPQVMTHELGGHAIGLLRDEYVYLNRTGVESNTVLYNCDRNSPPASEWREWEPVDYSLGCYENVNWYRPSPTSLMREINVYYFNSVSIGYINRMLDVVAGPFINDTIVPSVALLSPQEGQTHSGSITLSAEATDNYGIANVDFVVDGKVVHTDTSAPYSYEWPTAADDNGTHSIFARAYDLAHNSADSSAVTIVVENVTDATKPTVSFVSPSSGANVSYLTQVSVTAGDDSGVVSLVEFFVDGKSIGSDTIAPFGVVWNTQSVPNGQYTLVARATDPAGNVGEGAVVVTVANPVDVTPPVVTITNPLNGTIFDGKGKTTISATAADDTAVATIKISVDEKIVATCTASVCSYSLSESGLAAGVHIITAVATDTNNNSASAQITTSRSGSGGGGNTGGKGRIK